MKKKYLLVGSLAFLQWFAQAQTPSDSSSFKINKTEIDLVYNHYLQDGDRSAVTGGIGTEKLIVYSSGINIKQTKKRKIINFKAGADVISSASTDKIDFVMSSASRMDIRGHINLSSGRYSKDNRGFINIGTGISAESDYISVPVNVSLVGTTKNQLQTYSADLQVFFDDLRWGPLMQSIVCLSG